MKFDPTISPESPGINSVTATRWHVDFPTSLVFPGFTSPAHTQQHNYDIIRIRRRIEVKNIFARQAENLLVVS